jgi:hypothetical protein
MTVPMVPTAGRPSQPPIPLPVQVPVGHVVHQIMDESGQLRHVIVSPQRAPDGQVSVPFALSFHGAPLNRCPGHFFDVLDAGFVSEVEFYLGGSGLEFVFFENNLLDAQNMCMHGGVFGRCANF